MKKLIFFFLATMLMASAMAQTINISFTGQKTDGSYVYMDSVKIENTSRSWIETLYYPDMVLTFNQTGIEEVSVNNATLKAFPNPFNARTNLSLQLSNNDNVTLQIFNFAGQKVAEYSQNLEAGVYLFDLSMKTPQVYLAVLSTSRGRSTVKMVNRAKGEANAITIKGFGPLTEKMVSTQTFQPGDVLRYTGYATIARQAVVSTTIQQAQSESEVITLSFVLPDVTTDTITNITDNLVTCQGNVTSAGNTNITARGFCYSTSQYPTLNDSVVTASVSDTGVYTCNLTNLTPNTTYYVRAYATNHVGTTYGVEKRFRTLALPAVTTDTITNITDSSATCRGNVTYDGNTNITAKGFCYSTSHNPTINDSVITATTRDTGVYICNIVNLTMGTTYYVRAYVTNSIGTTYGVEKSFRTLALPTITTDTITNITDSTATCRGYATSDSGVNITARGFCYSTLHNPTLNDRVVIANTSDTGSYTCNLTNLTIGTTYYVRAYATNHVGTSYGVEKQFSTTGVGSLNGLFSTSAVTQVQFSKGNLQWSATGTHANIDSTMAGTWRFAEHQYDYVGDADSGNVYVGSTKCNNDSISNSYTGWIDLFGWGTSGYNNKHPYMTSTGISDYGDGTNDIAGTNYDWGVYNAISNGGNQSNMWRTLTKDEWGYLFNTRNASTINGTTNARYAEVRVNGVAGIMLFPDVFTWPSGAGTAPTTFNTYQNNWNSVNYTTAQFMILENSGVVFLPTSGYRSGVSSRHSGFYGYYWSSTSTGSYRAHNLTFGLGYVYPQNYDTKSSGDAVRLVRNILTVTTGTITNIIDSSATCQGNVLFNGGANIIARGFCYSTLHNPTLNDSVVVATTIGTGIYTCNLTNLIPNTTYYVRAYATNSIGTAYGVEKSFTTLALPIVTTDTITNITDSSATLQGNVTFAGGSTITSRGFCYSTSQNPTLNDSVVVASISDTGIYVCNFTNLTTNTTYYVRAYATNSIGTSYGVEKSFTTKCTGSLNGQFSVSDTTHVCFSKGNLQWSATGTHAVNGGGTAVGTWRFAEHQYDYVGDASNGNVYIGGTKCNNASISSSYTGWIDLFGWGTSAYGSKYPYMTSTSDSDYPSTIANTNYDWGVYNAISNGGNQPNMWRTLTKDEWVYLFNTRTASTINGTTNARYAEVRVNGVCGIMLFPDVFTWPSSAGSAPTTFNTYQNNWNSVNYTTAQFTILENSGVVFLPTSGSRDGSSVSNTNSLGLYCSSTSYNSNTVYYTFFGLGNIDPQSRTYRSIGLAVRLVR